MEVACRNEKELLGGTTAMLPKGNCDCVPMPTRGGGSTHSHPASKLVKLCTQQMDKEDWVCSFAQFYVQELQKEL